jgi:hypothetical protein
VPYVLGSRPLVVHADRRGPQPESRDQIERPAPAGVLDCDGVARFEVGGEDPFDGVEGAGDDGEGPVGHAVGGEFGPRDPCQLRLHGVLPVQDGRPVAVGRGRRERPLQGRQQRGVRVAARHVAHVLGHVHPDVVPPGRGRHGPHPAAPSAGRLDDPALAQRAVRGGDRVGVHAEVRGQLPYGRQKLAGPQLARTHRTLDARGNVRCAPSSDPIFF